MKCKNRSLVPHVVYKINDPLLKLNLIQYNLIVYWCLTRLPYHTINSNKMSVTIGTLIANHYRNTKVHPLVFLSDSCCSIFSFLCIVLQIIVFFFFLLVIVLCRSFFFWSLYYLLFFFLLVIVLSVVLFSFGHCIICRSFFFWSLYYLLFFFLLTIVLSVVHCFTAVDLPLCIICRSLLYSC